MSRVIINLDVVLAERKMSLTELSQKLVLQCQTFQYLKKIKQKQLVFSTLESLCEVLDCQPGDIIEYR